MATLTIDTATSIASVGLVVSDGTVVSASPIREQNAAQHVLAAVDQVLGDAGLTMADIRLVAVGRGPGSFTGLRIGLATALGLSEALGIATIGVDTLAALLAGSPSPVIAVIDARRGEVFAQSESIAAASFAPEELSALVKAGATVVGDGALRYRELFVDAGCLVPAADDALHWPNAAVMSRLAHADPQPATAFYLRAPDAVPAVIA
ncbi:MAG: tRNA (adenosine(37)-N6)-threonylcarbamoyltransferase complex dimerization subunit type 1 TsaB [Thermoleophilia bacterium]